MTDPRRWMYDESAPDELRRLLGGVTAPAPMTAESRARGRKAVRRIASLPVGLAAWMGAKGAVAAMGTLAAVSTTTFVALEMREPRHEPWGDPSAVAAPSSKKPGRANAAPAVPEDLSAEDDEAVAPEPPAVAPPSDRPVARFAHHEAPRTPAADSRGDLRAESRLLETARAQLSQHPAEALRLATEHRRQFPGGQLGAERTLIEIDALSRLGRAAEARSRAEAFLRRHPGGLYAERVRRLVSGNRP